LSSQLFHERIMHDLCREVPNVQMQYCQAMTAVYNLEQAIFIACKKREIRYNSSVKHDRILNGDKI